MMTKISVGGVFEDYLSVQNSLYLKGIFSIFILCHHLFQHSGIFDGLMIAIILQAMGYLSVGVFFFLSGFGLEVSYIEKGSRYIRDLPRNRIAPFYIIYLLLVILYTFIYLISGTRRITMKLLISSISWGGTVITNGWYLQVILLLYLLYFIVYSCRIKNTYKKIFIVVGLVAVSLLCRNIGLGLTWYQSIFAFFLGMMWFDYKEWIDRYTSNNWHLFFLTSLLLFVATFLLGRHYVIFNMISAVAFVVLLLLLLMKIPLKNVITAWLGKYYFAIYVMQGVPLVIFHSDIIYIENQWLYILLCTITTLILAVAVHPVFQFINKTVKREVIA